MNRTTDIPRTTAAPDRFDPTDPRPQILMCPPDHYGVMYEINPWMNRSQQPDHELAMRQWHGLREKLVEAGARILQQPPVPGLPDLVFTANAALIYRKTAILSRFRFPERQGEEPHDAEWLTANGFEVRRLREDIFFEGAGDALFCGDSLIAGYRIRSDVRGHQQIGEMLGVHVIPLELVDPYYYHLDTCFCPLEPGVAIYFPEAFDEYGRKALAEAVPRLVPVQADEARRFACNAVVVGKTVITNVGCEELHRSLAELGYHPVATPLNEFVKAGGSAKCLTLRLDGEEAASWKYAG
jgi:N-dimethylarginine dimethylaminohydrolase